MSDDEKSEEAGVLRKAAKQAAGAAASGATAALATTGSVKAAALGAVITGASVGAKEITKGLIEHFALPATRRLREEDARLGALQTYTHLAKAKAIHDIADELEEQLEKLRDHIGDDHEVASAAAAVADAWERAWDRTADAKKRRLLMAALLQSFDPAIHDEGETLTLFSLLERVDYGDVFFLRRVPEYAESRSLPERIDGWGDVTLEATSASFYTRSVITLRKLRDLQLTDWPNAYRNDEPGVQYMKKCRRTYLGNALLRIIERGFPDDDNGEGDAGPSGS